MTPRDIENTEFLMSLSKEELAMWLKSIDNDEALYALALIQCAVYELSDECIQVESDCLQAKRILNRIIKKVKKGM